MSEPDRRGRGRPRIPRERQRQRLLEAAELVFEQSRYESSGVQEIVRRAGMSSRSFYEFFASKEALVAELARDRAESFLVRIEQILGEADEIATAIDSLLRLYLQMLPIVLIDLERIGGTAGQRVREIRAEYRERIHARLMHEFAQLAERGVIHALPDPMSVELVLAGIEGMSIHYHNEGRREELVALHGQLLLALRRFFPEFLAEGATE